MCPSVTIELIKPAFLWFHVSAAPQPLQNSVFSYVCCNSTPTIGFLPLVSPLHKAVYPQLLTMQVAYWLCVQAGKHVELCFGAWTPAISMH